MLYCWLCWFGQVSRERDTQIFRWLSHVFSPSQLYLTSVPASECVDADVVFVVISVLCCRTISINCQLLAKLNALYFNHQYWYYFNWKHSALCVRTFDTRVVANNLWSHPGQGPGSARVRVPGMVSYSHPNILCCWNVHISAFALYVVSPPPDLFIWTQAILIFSALMRWVSSPGHGLSIFVSAHFPRVTETDRSNINSAQVKYPILKV